MSLQPSLVADDMLHTDHVEQGEPLRIILDHDVKIALVMVITPRTRSVHKQRCHAEVANLLLMPADRGDDRGQIGGYGLCHLHVFILRQY